MIELRPRLAEGAVPLIRRRGKDLAMPRFVLVAIALLSVLTALTLLGTAVVLRPPALAAEADGPREAANRALAYRFYGAANAAIATGDAAPLAALLAPGFVERSIPPDPVPDRDGLVGRLLAIHAAAPEVRLVPEAVAADGDLVIASVLVDGPASPTLVGLRLGGGWTAWGPVDVFRLAGGRIVERRGPAADSAPPAPEFRVGLEVPPPDARNLTAARIQLAPGASHATPRVSGPRLVLAEGGEVVVSWNGRNPAPPAVLRAGEHLVLAAGLGVTFRNTGLSPATLLEVTIVAVPFGDSAPEMGASPEAGVTTKVLANDMLIAVPAGSVVVSVGRATLALGERLRWAAAAGPVLIHVEAGTLELTATGSVPWVDGAVGRRSGAGVEATLAAGGGALLEAGAAAEVRAGAGGPATLLLLTLLPADDPPPFDDVAAMAPTTVTSP